MAVEIVKDFEDDEQPPVYRIFIDGDNDITLENRSGRQFRIGHISDEGYLELYNRSEDKDALRGIQLDRQGYIAVRR